MSRSYKLRCAGLSRHRMVRHSPVSRANRRWFHAGHRGKPPTYKGHYAITSPCWRPQHSRKYIHSTRLEVLRKKARKAGIRLSVEGKAKRSAAIKAELTKRRIKY